MSNMGHCRFQNTAADLADCAEHWLDDGLSLAEHSARKRMLKLMIHMLRDVGANIDHKTLDELPAPYKSGVII